MGKSILSMAVLAGLVSCMAFCTGCSSAPGPSSSGDGADAALPHSVRLDGVTYQRGAYGQDGEVPTASVDRRAAVGKVESEVANYDLRDGQATYLRPGTRLYAVRGYDPSFRLAAREENENGPGNGWALYEVWSNPGAKDAAELLDVWGKVERISVLDTFERSANAPEEVASFREPGEVTATVDAMLRAPLKRTREDAYRYYVVFRLEDGTQPLRPYNPRSGELYLSRGEAGDGPSSGVTLPEKFRNSVEGALRGDMARTKD